MDLMELINAQIGKLMFHECEYTKKMLSVKKHSDHLEKKGEFCFLFIRLLQSTLKNDDLKVTLEAALVGDVKEELISRMNDLIETSMTWPISLTNYCIENDRCLLFLDRLKAIDYALKSVESKELFSSMKDIRHLRRFNMHTIHIPKSGDLASLRASLVARTLKNVLEYFMDFNEAVDRCDFSIDVRPMCFKGKDLPESKIIIYTGIANDKESNGIPMTAEEYERLRATDMKLIAMHKYGIRMKDKDNFKKLIHRLGEAAVKFDLLESKHTSPILVKRNGQGCTKGAAFILYNSARIATLLRKFGSNVEKRIYPDLPGSDDIDISLLKEEEEWNLVFNYILGFPNLLKRCIDGIEEGKCAPHLLIQFIFGLVNIFSVYYRRTRVLIEGPDHLIPLVHARIYLIRCIEKILTCALRIINVDPIQYM